MIIKSEFQAAWWLKNAHLQTIWSSQFRKLSAPETTQQRLEMNDGDFIDLEWLNSNTKGENNNNDPEAAILLLLHGLARFKVSLMTVKTDCLLRMSLMI